MARRYYFGQGDIVLCEAMYAGWWAQASPLWLKDIQLLNTIMFSCLGGSGDQVGKGVDVFIGLQSCVTVSTRKQAPTRLSRTIQNTALVYRDIISHIVARRYSVGRDDIVLCEAIYAGWWAQALPLWLKDIQLLNTIMFSCLGRSGDQVGKGGDIFIGLQACATVSTRKQAPDYQERS